jgi:hypothetical protein
VVVLPIDVEAEHVTVAPKDTLSPQYSPGRVMGGPGGQLAAALNIPGPQGVMFPYVREPETLTDEPLGGRESVATVGHVSA